MHIKTYGCVNALSVCYMQTYMHNVPSFYFRMCLCVLGLMFARKLVHTAAAREKPRPDRIE